ncbi:hypothetical protein BBW65_03445 [Helicobacter enhydrae]|uniref:Uncharacterized protein n=1 Tax=Helicobacter enhydrae TaxID=222136 RepID=A0A1B1U579_9HELI|nr:hypothetical protein [Helicobacter enhydrae]ANV97910.1 hypothetical protein BBW65_03445 [Helicobacter enhydrae]
MCLIILSALASIYLPKLPNLNQAKCLQHLREKLNHANSQFTQLYAQKLLDDAPIHPMPILQSLTQTQNPRCFFALQGRKLIAHILSTKLVFNIEPYNLSSKPKIYCNLSNPLCQKFLGKKLQK